MPLDQPLLVTSYALLKQKDYFFILLQSELGDLYKVSLVLAPEPAAGSGTEEKLRPPFNE